MGFMHVCEILYKVILKKKVKYQTPWNATGIRSSCPEIHVTNTSFQKTNIYMYDPYKICQVNVNYRTDGSIQVIVGTLLTL